MKNNGGSLFEHFMKEQLSPGGVYFHAVEDELISGPFESLQFLSESHVGWETEILPNDILNLMSFKTKNYSSKSLSLISCLTISDTSEFSRAYGDYQSQTARDNGHMLQSYYGPQLPSSTSTTMSSTASSSLQDSPGLLEHYTADGQSFSFRNDLAVSRSDSLSSR
jgi:hypothetical protein